MFRIWTFIVLSSVTIVLSGCGAKSNADISITGDNGEKVTIKSEGDKGSLTATGSNGEHVELNANNGEMKLNGSDKDGSKVDLKVGGSSTITEGELGLPFYPGSKQGSDVRAEDAKTGSKSVTSMRSTTDDLKKVVDFYKEKLKGINASVQVSESNTGSDESSFKLKGVLDRMEGKFAIEAGRKKGESQTEISVSITRDRAK